MCIRKFIVVTNLPVKMSGIRNEWNLEKFWTALYKEKEIGKKFMVFLFHCVFTNFLKF